MLRALVAAQCAQQEPLTGSWGGTGRFNPTEGSDGKPVLVALPDLPDLPEFRQDLVELLEDAGFEPAEDHGYTPHLTVAYDDNGRVRAMGELNCPIVAVVAAGGRVDFQLTGTEDDGDTDATMAEAAAVMVRCVDCGDSYAVDSMDEVAVHKAKHAEGDVEKAALSATDEVALAAESKRIAERKKLPAASARHNFRPARFTHPNGHPRCLVCGDEESTGGVCNAREAARTRSRVPVEPEGIRHGVAAVPTKAFLTEAYGRTVLTAPAAVWEKALTPNEHFLWMQGRFVGAEKANRNGAFWSTADLEMGEPTVKGGPLNWLHEDRHVIGSIVEAKLVMPGAEAAADGQLAEPHIVAASAAWKWLYPDECYVMEQASDQGKLWYSMECVAKQVSCVGDGGCGQTYGYGDVMKAAENVCQHIIQRSASRRMVDPTFLGGAVIVPPVRPGWGDADAQVMRQAASMAEKAFDQAGQPDVTASDWELLMRQVLSFIAR